MFPTQNFQTQIGYYGNVGNFANDLKMPLLNAAFQPSHSPGSIGLFSDKVYVRLLNQTVIELGGAGGVGTWAQVLVNGNLSGPTNAIMSPGAQFQLQDPNAVIAATAGALNVSAAGMMTVTAGGGQDLVVVSTTGDSVVSAPVGEIFLTSTSIRMSASGGTVQLNGDVNFLHSANPVALTVRSSPDADLILQAQGTGETIVTGTSPVVQSALVLQNSNLRAIGALPISSGLINLTSVTFLPGSNNVAGKIDIVVDTDSFWSFNFTWTVSYPGSSVSMVIGPRSTDYFVTNVSAVGTTLGGTISGTAPNGGEIVSLDYIVVGLA